MEVKHMTEIRASVTVEVHRKLKEEAARSGKHLKELVAEVLQVHVRNGSGESKGKAVKR
jgi:predicted HicB family RNase H-like nuclease